MDLPTTRGDDQRSEVGPDSRGETERQFKQGRGLSRQSARLREYSFSGREVEKLVVGFGVSPWDVAFPRAKGLILAEVPTEAAEVLGG